MRAGRYRGLPRAFGAKRPAFMPAGGIDNLDGERITAIKMPDLIGRQAVKCRKVLAGEQKENRRKRAARRAARGRYAIGAAKSLAKIAAFRMRRQAKFSDKAFSFRIHGRCPGPCPERRRRAEP